MQILEHVLRFRVVLGVSLLGGWQVVGGSKNVQTSVAAALCSSAKASEQANCGVHIKSLYHARISGMQGFDN